MPKRVSSLAACIGWTLVAACGFDSTGVGDGKGVPPVTTVPADETDATDGTGSGGGSEGLTSGGVSVSGTSGPGVSSADETTGPGMVTLTTDPGTTSGDDTTTSTTTLDPDTTMPDPSTTMAPDPSCLGPMAPLMVLSANAELEFPMIHEQSQQGEGTICSSGIPELGTAEFKFDVPCLDDYAVWARVYDDWDGTHESGDPDTYYVRVSGGDEFTWYYGCQTFGAPNNWGWRRVRVLSGNDCNVFTEWTPQLGPGSHSIRLRNREGERGNGVRAAVARVILSNDPNFVPTVQ